MKNLSGQESLWVALPMLIVLAILILGLIFLPQIQGEIRSRASEAPAAIITPSPTPETPEVVCSDLYSPVCGSNGETYPTACEANLAGVTTYQNGECASPTPTTNVSFPKLKYTLPTVSE